MRAAVLTTALVLAVLAIYAGQRDALRSSNQATRAAESSGGVVLPDVSAAPAGTGAALRDEPAPSEPIYAPATEPAARRHVVAPGDSLPALAEHYYGDAARADAIYEANRDQIRDPEHLHAGQTLIIP